MESRKTALITGATSGIGKAFAEEYAKQGYDLILTGRRGREIRKAAKDLSRRYRVEIRVVVAELSRRRDMAGLEAIARKETGIEVLVNNAGFGSKKRFLDDGIDASAAMVDAHVLAPMRLIRAVAPRMISRGKGTIINVASMAAFLPAAGSGLYSATKAFLHRFSESLFIDATRHGVMVQSLCPGFTYTDFHRKLGIRGRPKSRGLLRWMSAEDVVKKSLAALGKGTPLCIPGFWNKVALRLIMLVPRRIFFALTERVSKNVLSVKGNP
jgi:short-subunit dehydrogenase